MVRLRKGRVVLITLVIILILFVLISTFNGHMQIKNEKIGTYAKIIQEQRLKIEQLQDHNRNLEKINFNQHSEIRELQGSEKVSMTTVVPEVVDDIEENETETTENEGFTFDTVLVGATAVGVFMGNVFKYVRVLPVIP